MRFLVDECISRTIAERLRASGHDVVWIADCHSGETDRGVLKQSRDDSRIVLTADWDFGELVIRFEESALGIVIIAISQFTGDLDAFADRLAGELTVLGEELIGRLTIVEAGRIRQRPLAGSDHSET